MDAKRTVLVMLTCIILGVSQVLPALGGVQATERTASVPDSGLSIQAEVVNCEVTLRIIGPDGLPPTVFHLEVQQSSPSFNPFSNIYLIFGSEITLNLPQGTYLLQIYNDESKPQFLAYCYLTVTGDNIINIDVRPLVAPVTMEAINPLEGKPFNAGYYSLKDASTKKKWRFYDDEPGKALVYLPVNTKFDAMYYQWGYILFKPNVNVRGLNTKIQFDGSRTGYIQQEYVKPINSPSGDYFSELFLKFNDFVIEAAPTDAVSIGSYTAEGMVTNGDDRVLRFDLGRVSVAAKRITSIKFGGDMLMTVKAKKPSYKPGETLEVTYSVKDQFRHTLVAAQRAYEGTQPPPQVAWGVSASISDAVGLLSESSWDTPDFGGSMLYSMPISSLATSGTYLFNVTWDTELFQGLLMASSKVVVRSSSKIPSLMYDQVAGDPAADSYDVTLKLTGLDGQLANWAVFDILDVGLEFSSVKIDQSQADENGELTISFPRGTYLLMIHSYEPNHPFFIAYCYIKVASDGVADVDVQSLVVPVIFEAVNPLEGKNYTNGAFYVLDNAVKTSWSFYDLNHNQGSYVTVSIFLPKNLKFDAVYRDWGSDYLLYKPNVQARGTTTRVRLDGSRTGFIQPVFVEPTNSSGYQYGYSFSTIVFNDFIDDSGTAIGHFYAPTGIAISTGSYTMEVSLQYWKEEGGFSYFWDYSFKLSRVRVATGRTSLVNFGGDIVMTAKAKKSSYKPGESVEVSYSISDQFRHSLTYSGKWLLDMYTREPSYPPWNMKTSISDANIVLAEEMWEASTVGGAMRNSTSISAQANSGKYTYSVTWDTEAYQGPVSASAKFSVRSTSKIPEIDYNHLSGRTVTIGVIAPDDLTLETWAPFFTEIIQPDLNTQYADQNIQFDFTTSAGGVAQTHLDQVTAFHESGVDLVIGGGWSSQAQASLYYVNTNSMILVSPSSTSPTLNIADNLFRFCSSDSYIAPSLVDMLWSKGVRSVVIIQRADSWGDGIVNLFKPAWTAKGGKLAGDTVRYAAEATDFTGYLQLAENQATAALTTYPGKVAVLLLSFNEAATILTQAEGYPHIYGVKWYGADGTAASQGIIDGAGTQAVQVGLNSLLSQTPDSVEYQALGDRYFALTGQQLGVYTAYLYDIAFALAGTAVQTESTDGGVVAAAFPGFCKAYAGVTGNCALNVFGDRVPGPYDIWSYRYASGTAGPIEAYVAGQVIPTTRRVTWNN